MRLNDAAPRLAYWLLEAWAPARSCEAMIGDLMEEHALRCRSSSRSAATRWLWGQVCRSLLAIIAASLRGEDLVVRLDVALSVYAFVAGIKLMLDSALARLLAQHVGTLVVLAPLLFLVASAVGGGIAGRLERGAPALLAVFIMLTVVCLLFARSCTVAVPWWYGFTFLTLGPLAALVTPAAFCSSHR